jgi:hypothetical protein
VTEPVVYCDDRSVVGTAFFVMIAWLPENLPPAAPGE